MQFRDFKKWLPLIFLGVPLCWVSAYLWAWMAREGCGTAGISACWTEALAGWLADIVMFKWMDNTLGAGMLAMVGAGLVLVAAAYQRQTALADATEQRRTALLARLGLISMRFQRLNSYLFEGRNSDAAALLVDLETNLSGLLSQAPGLAHWLQLIIAEIDIHIQGPIDLASIEPEFWKTTPDTWKALAYSVVIQEFLRHYERLVDPDGSYRHRPAPAEHIRDRLSRLSKLTLDDLSLARGMFADKT